jgi:hypothetical protein
LQTASGCAARSTNFNVYPKVSGPSGTLAKVGKDAEVGRDAEVRKNAMKFTMLY